jgi:hypothetical protein
VSAASDALRASLADAAPALDLAPPLAALWWAGRGDWERAHRLVQDADGAEAAWVHAYLHRVEGDLANAGYWYARAGRPAAKGDLETEWATIAAALSPASP